MRCVVFLGLLLMATASGTVEAQHCSVKGYVHDRENMRYLPATTVCIMPEERHLQTDTVGFFQFDGLKPGHHLLTVSYMGYKSISVTLTLVRDTLLHLDLKPESVLLSEIHVTAVRNHSAERYSSLPVEEIGHHFLLQHHAVSFAKTLTAIPGVASMDIGAGFSKPVIRGMGFNRIAVVDRGIVQQNQQWGSDHGLEIDQYDVDRVMVHKGPMSLFFGSDAMGGVIRILPPALPDHDLFWGDVTGVAKSNNALLGTSVSASLKRGNWFFRGRVTAQKYGDYRIPADTISYLTWRMPIHHQQVKNSAGKEYNLSLSIHYGNEKAESQVYIAHVNGKNGFFPGSHGIPKLSRLEPDASTRNIELPYAASSHSKIISNTVVRFTTSELSVDLGFQRNRRVEMSQFHTHYSNQRPPAEHPDRELLFLLRTYSTNIRWMTDLNARWSSTVGISAEQQRNEVDGYAFLLPRFRRTWGAIYWLHSVQLRPQLSLTGGIRYDIGSITVGGYYDPVLAEYLQGQAYPAETVATYAQRATNLRKRFGDFSGSVGIGYTPDNRQTLKINLGRSFRYPSANELASNGVHHGAFRHEKGDSTLLSEKGYQIDIDYRYATSSLQLTANPFLAYFTNYIYLGPSGTWSLLPHTGQIYHYRQAKAYMAGGELSATYRWHPKWEVFCSAAYVHNLNLSDGYPLPFSPSATITGRLAYSDTGGKALATYTLRVENRWIMAQNRIAKNEEKTPGTNLWNLSAEMHWKVKGKRIITLLQIENLFDTAFLNHLSFYRKLNAPEPGRNLQLIVKIPF